jgi:hypothetical protein
VLIPKNLKLFRMNTYEKQGEGVPKSRHSAHKAG